MGSKLSRAVRGYAARNDRRLLLVGLDGAGKSTVLAYVRKRRSAAASSNPSSSATTGVGRGGGTDRSKNGTKTTVPGNADFDVETIKHGKLKFHLWDVRGQDHMRPYWRHYYTGTQGVVFVVDASDDLRMEAAIAELRTLAVDAQLADAAILVLANKCDVPSALSAAELSKRMDLQTCLFGHPWHVQATSAVDGKGVEEGLAFLAANMRAL